ncbi:hypothetical protein EDB85DRAFT_1565921 [Lactarius pseudohatsudake]|nr:hypothetical protein EDB85DRAFT_1565921 [Lactarius pseudohatsudake]
MRRKTWRKELADEAEVGESNDSNDESDGDDDGPRAHAISAVFTNARRKKRTPTSSSSGVLPGGLTLCYHCRSTIRRPKMRCTLIKASTDKRPRNLFCDGCIEKRYALHPSLHIQYIFLTFLERRYPQLTFDRAAEDVECPACRNYCNCSLCSRKRGEAYIPERDAGGAVGSRVTVAPIALRRSLQRRARAKISGRRRQRRRSLRRRRRR